jgi:NitT/TauT family transport system substrate-binding protein
MFISRIAIPSSTKEGNARRRGRAAKSSLATRRGGICVAAMLGAALASACTQAAEQNLRKVIVTQSVADSVSFAPMFIARHFHYFEEEGLQTEVVITSGGGPDVAALIAGQAQFTAAGPINQLALYQQGQKTLSVASFFDRLVADIVVSKDVYEGRKLGPLSIEDRIKALKGLKISVTRLGALTDMVIRSYLRRAGLNPEQDAKIIATTSGAPQMAALQHKEVDAASVTSPAAEEIVARGAGVMLVNNTNGEDPFFVPFTQQTILVRPDWARQNPDVVRAFVRAVVKADKWAHDHTAAEGAKIMQSLVPSLDVNVLAQQYALVKDGFPIDGCMTQKGIEANLTLFEAAGLLTQKIGWTDIVTNQYLPTPCNP